MSSATRLTEHDQVSNCSAYNGLEIIMSSKHWRLKRYINQNFKYHKMISSHFWLEGVNVPLSNKLPFGHQNQWVAFVDGGRVLLSKRYAGISQHCQVSLSPLWHPCFQLSRLQKNHSTLVGNIATPSRDTQPFYLSRGKATFWKTCLCRRKRTLHRQTDSTRL